ncbi:serine/threonine protein kinase PRR1 NDAI_0K01480 [Naumovozyma dairenensis CBS 421]|uniref:Protein kinase domain-containing protein n=1 Tax=Naumovozyma dairenensis (strain ATCC 10597 / BCRC 20456 / CBS 421 / NBRC 0211 / NRRL Y-12639) TaxID=1071378 RepID=G0WHS8_NAUDC|nr:hypothetical protein NDAI_0K01480 [Naumovozyma dairenensis CBS 421]CCD27339.1 hypothetical protein NDAI_0K01480 [Naumovozyma dairenensis CBS 421]
MAIESQICPPKKPQGRDLEIPKLTLQEELNNNSDPNSNLKENIDPEKNSIMDKNITQDADQETTPLSLTIPTFEHVTMLPTPMTYTPLSPGGLALSPIIDQHLNIAKRRAGGTSKVPNIQHTNEFTQMRRDLDGLLEPQQRIVSELAPPPLSSPQRIVSLPTVTEEASSQSLELPIVPNNALVDLDSEHQEDFILTGYLLGQWDKPLQWKKIKKLGEGNFSDVLLYESFIQDDPNLIQVAVKRIKYPMELNDETFRNTPQYKDTISRLENSLTRELTVLKSLNHPCIVKLFGINSPIFLESKTPLRDFIKSHGLGLPPCDMIMSYCAGGDLLAAVTSCLGELDIWLIQRIFTELVIAVKYLHDNNIIHRDLKLENILLKYSLHDIVAMKDSPMFKRQNILELADFGLCKKIDEGEMCTARCGSEDYVSPEILMGIPYDGHLTDSWALGVILYALLEDRLPFDPPPNATSRQRSRATSHRIARFDWRWFRLAETDLDAKEIVENTLTRKNQRWNVNDLLESSFVKKELDTLLL